MLFVLLTAVLQPIVLQTKKELQLTTAVRVELQLVEQITHLELERIAVEQLQKLELHRVDCNF